MVFFWPGFSSAVVSSLASSLEAQASEVQAFEAKKWPAYLEAVEVEVQVQEKQRQSTF